MQALQSKNFERIVEAILRNNFASRYRQLTAGQIKTFIHQGLEKAQSRGITRQQSVCKYIILMFVFGRAFEDNPNLHWHSPLKHHPVSDMAVYQTYESAIASLKTQYQEVR